MLMVWVAEEQERRQKKTKRRLKTRRRTVRSWRSLFCDCECDQNVEGRSKCREEGGKIAAETEEQRSALIE